LRDVRGDGDRAGDIEVEIKIIPSALGDDVVLYPVELWDIPDLCLKPERAVLYIGIT
jgi:hypothetical protein